MTTPFCPWVAQGPHRKNRLLPEFNYALETVCTLRGLTLEVVGPWDGPIPPKKDWPKEIAAFVQNVSDHHKS